MLARSISGVKAIRTEEGRRIYTFPAPGWNMCVPGVIKQFVRKKELQHMTGECREVRGIHEKCFHSRNISLQTCQGVINIRKELLVKGKLTIAIRSAIHPTGVAGCASHWPFQSNQSIPPPFLPFRFFFSRAVYHMNRPILLAWSVHPEYLQRSNEAAAAR